MTINFTTSLPYSNLHEDNGFGTMGLKNIGIIALTLWLFLGGLPRLCSGRRRLCRIVILVVLVLEELSVLGTRHHFVVCLQGIES